MTQKLTALLLFCSFLASAQVFNKAFTYTANEWCNAVMVKENHVYASLSANIHFGPTYNVLHKMDAAGNILKVDTFEVIRGGYPVHLGPDGFMQLPDSSFFLYGGYIDGCDVNVKGGAFVIHYDSDLNELNRTVLPDSALDRYEMWKFGSNRYALTCDKSITLLDSHLVKTHYFGDSTWYNRGTVRMPGDSFLRISETTHNTDTAYYFNVGTYATTAAPVFKDSIYDLGNDNFITAKGFKKIVRYSKSGLQKIDSVNVLAAAGFLPSQLDVQSEAIIVTDTQNFALFSKTDLALIAKGEVAKNGEYLKYSGDLFYSDSALVVATNNRTGQVDLEAIRIGKPRSSLFNDIKLKVENTAHYGVRLDSLTPSLRRGNSIVNWRFTAFNTSTDTLKRLAINYNYYYSYMCTGDNFMIARENLSVAPGDSISVSLDSIFHSRVFTGPDYGAVMSASVVMANELIVKSGGWSYGAAVIKNVATPEPEVAQPMHVYPNPASSYLKVQYGEAFEGAVEIYNMAGQLLYRELVFTEGGEALSISLQTIPAGVYILKIESGKLNYTQRFIKK